MSAPEVNWLPEKDFYADNFEALEGIFAVTREAYPASGAPEKLGLENETPTPEALRWMWTHFMGHQHGTLEGRGDKIELDDSQATLYLPYVRELHYGPHRFTEPTGLDPSVSYSKAFILGGMPQENTDRLMAATGYTPREADVSEFIMLGGQRLRGIWKAKSEESVRNVYETVARYSGADMDQLEAASPWIQANSKLSGEDMWQRPFASEFELGRLTAEAVFRECIDWSEYPVETTYDVNANPQSYDTPSGKRTIPAREIAMVTYQLTDGRKVYVVNGKAVPRLSSGSPRPTSDSTVSEAVELTGINDNERLVLATSVPHIRAAVDGLIRILKLRSDKVSRADIVSGQWLPEIELLAALGEIPATGKADRRLRAVLQGEDPDSPTLTQAD